MRVIAGKARRLPLKTIDGPDTRPTTDRIKETLFNIINPDLPGCRFLDLFSGCGGIGIEALSRGAAAAVFVENSKSAIACIKENLEFTRLKEQGTVMAMDVSSAINMLKGKGIFDIVFMDAPYQKGYERDALERLKTAEIIDENSVIIIEEKKDTDFNYLEDIGFVATRIKEYKTNKHVFVKLA